MSEFRHCEFGYESGFDIDFNPSKYKTAKGAATAFFLAAFKLAGELGYSKNDVSLWSPEQSRERINSDGWTVVWESGPSEWGTCTCISGKGWEACPHWSFSLVFYDA